MSMTGGHSHGEPIRLQWCGPEAGAAVVQVPAYAEMLARGVAMADIGLTTAEVCERIYSGEYRVIVVRGRGNAPLCLVIVEIAHVGAEQKKTLSVVAAGGEKMGLWLFDVQKALREVARSQGCVRVIVLGRQGWERALRQYGWKKTGVIMEVGPESLAH